MGMLQRVRWREVNWGPLVMALCLTGFGWAFVLSATTDPHDPYGWGREARMQMLWWGTSFVMCLICMHIPLTMWRRAAPVLYAGMLGMQAFMLIMAGTALVPTIKGAHNWIALGPARLQPSEFYKIATLLLCARLLTQPGADPRRFIWVIGILAVGGLPSLLIAKEDLGSALTFLPMVLGMLFFAGMRLRHLTLILVLLAGTVAAGISVLPRDGYQYKRIRAWLDPESYALTEGYQTIRSLRAVGSGQWTGKGYGLGDQNLLGWLPEKHTDMIFAVIGEETGFLGCFLALALFLTFAWVMIFTAMRCRDPYGRLVVGGFTCLVMGQVAINLSVVLGLMPVTGITLPFFSYGGSSLLGLYIGIGICLSATVARHHELGRHQYMTR